MNPAHTTNPNTFKYCISVIAQVLGQPVYRTLKEEAGKYMAPLEQNLIFFTYII